MLKCGKINSKRWVPMKIEFSNTYSDLGSNFGQSIEPSSAVDPELILFNHDLASFLGIDSSSASENELAGIFSGKTILEKSRPFAMAYAGHQFGHFVPQLGDGRAILLGEVEASNRKYYDLQLKGAGQTAFSRRGDGRSSLGPVIREYIVSEAMHALGVPSTRALAAVTTGETVYREDALPGGILTRVASSHIRVGTFEYFAYRKDEEELKVLVDYAIKRHHPDLSNEDEKYFEFFKAVARRKLKLVAKWMGLGFIHGVMNTDNTTISGETIDFGPCAFMDIFSHDKVFSSIDHQGRYSYHNQGSIALWNLSCLASCLVPLLGLSQTEAQKKFEPEFETLTAFFKDAWRDVMAKKMGIFTATSKDNKLINEFLKYLEENKMDFTNSFRELPKRLNDSEGIYKQVKKRLEEQAETFEEAISLMDSVNPYIIPRNHLVERSIDLSIKEDYSLFKRMVEAFKEPYKENQNHLDLTLPPKPDEIVYQTFCGT
tara:strand:- start:22 stop:1485 length:1464 start_codon:yes stop_codon:yes gene_type:complete